MKLKKITKNNRIADNITLDQPIKKINKNKHNENNNNKLESYDISSSSSGDYDDDNEFNNYDQPQQPEQYNNNIISSNTSATTPTPPKFGNKMLNFIAIVESVGCVVEMLIISNIFNQIIVSIGVDNLIINATSTTTQPNNSRTISFLISLIFCMFYIFKRFGNLLNLINIKNSINYVKINKNETSKNTNQNYSNHTIKTPKWLGIFKKIQINFKRLLVFLSFELLLFLIVILYQYITGNWFFNLNNLKYDGIIGQTTTTTTKGNDNLNYQANEIDWYKIIIFLIIGPAYEEILFRGVTFYIMIKRCKNLWLSILVPSILFGLFHLLNLFHGYFSIFYIVFQTLIGILFGMNLQLSFYSDQTIYTPIIMHSFNNLLSLLMPNKITFEIIPIIILIITYQTLILIYQFNLNFKKIKIY